jgi:hypothetical protein
MGNNFDNCNKIDDQSCVYGNESVTGSGKYGLRS